ncbi:MFS transporter [Bombiscardovia nodaiensis]|uniref:MFS transporter n=1 Tax=Bombiscardovia nodaiensis TaxID=2932181 RepID=A0ABM8B672_9BIFI|nr:MFS transporter [Bombiscardovia nodaiensis]
MSKQTSMPASTKVPTGSSGASAHKAAPSPVPVAHPWLAIAALMIGAFVGMLSETSLNIALPNLMEFFKIPNATAQWLVTGYMLVIGIVLPFSSLIGKWFTTRQTVIFGLLAFLLGSVISALAPSFAVLLVGRLIQGIGTGLVLPLMFTVAMLIFPPAKLGTVMGMCALVIMFAPAIGPTLTGIILGKLSWNWVFWFFTPFLVIALIFSIFFLKNVGQITRPHVDLLSILGSIVGFGGLVAGVSLASKYGWLSPVTLVILVVAIVALVLYARRQLHLEQPVLNLRIFSIEAFRSGAILVMLDFAVILAAMYLLPQYFQRGLLVAVALTGVLMLPGGVVNAGVSAIAGKLYDGFGAKLPVRCGFAIALVGALMLLFTTSHSPLWFVVAAHIVMMVGCPLAMSPAQTYALNSLSPMQSGDGSTIINTMQQIVGAVATAVTTSLLAIGESHATGASPAQAFTSGMHLGLWFVVVLIVVALLVSLKIKNFSHAADHPAAEQAVSEPAQA